MYKNVNTQSRAMFVLHLFVCNYYLFVDHHISSPLNYHWVCISNSFFSHTDGRLFYRLSISRTVCILM
jgi:hypothetical protein